MNATAANAPRSAVNSLPLLAVLAALTAIFAIIACDPSTPAAQSPTATPTPLNTATSTATPTPTAAPPPTATPAPTITADKSKLSPEVNALLSLYAAAQSDNQAPSSASQSAEPVPETVTLYISTKRNFNQSIQTFLTNNGGTVTSAETRTEGTRYHSGILAEVPLSLISKLSRQPGVGYAITNHVRYEKLEGDLSDLVLLYEAGSITALEGARQSGAQWHQDRVTVDIYYESCTNIPGIVRFVEDQIGVSPWWYDATASCYGAGGIPFVYALVPFSSLARLSQQPGVQRIKPIIREPTGMNWGSTESSRG